MRYLKKKTLFVCSDSESALCNYEQEFERFDCITTETISWLSVKRLKTSYTSFFVGAELFLATCCGGKTDDMACLMIPKLLYMCT